MDNLPSTSGSAVDLSDVLAAIETADPTFAEDNRDVEMMNAAMEPRPQAQGARTKPRIEIVEQPASKGLRFRYECEGRSAGSIPGVNSTPENRTYPTIRIVGYKGRAMVVVSCVTKDPPFRPHPHNLVGRDVCRQGVCTIEVPTDTMTVSFDKLGVQCVKRKDIEEALRVREEIRVDPFRTGFDHKRQPTSLDLNVVRLCFQAFLPGTDKEFSMPLQPVVSEPIFDKKAMSDLMICKLSHCAAPVSGGMEMVLLCEKVTKEDIKVRFFEEKNGICSWEDYGDFPPTHVHKQVAIYFRTPKYCNQDVDQPVPVYIQLQRPSDNAMSEPLHFQFVPLGLDDPEYMRIKRKRIDSGPRAYMLRQVQAEAEKQHGLLNQPPTYFNIVKSEPPERSSPFGPVPSPSLIQFGPSNPGPSNMNMNTLQPINSPGDGRSPPPPMEQTFYMDTMQPQQNVQNQLQPINIENAPQQLLIEDPNMGNIILGVQEVYQITNPNMITNVIGSAIGNAIDIVNVGEGQQPQEQQPAQDYFAQLENVDLNSLNISDILRAPINGEEAAGGSMGETGMTDSFTKLTRKTIQELCSLNNLSRDN